MKIGSLFDGSGGFPLAASMCGIEPTWASEVEPYPIAVTRSRFPNMKHLGSVTDVKGDEVEPVDIITFGSPCQDLSVAGKRAGLKHTENGDEETTRSGLFMEAVRIIKEMRKATNGEYPRYAIWENVPGAFSSNKGLDFRVVLEELIRISEPTAVMPDVPKAGWSYADVYCGDGWSLAYRVLDAQYWGVPQRRRRIYLVADFRGQRAGKILFERQGLRGYLAESGTQREAAPGNAQSGIGADDREEKVNNGVIPINTMVATRHKCDDGRTTFGVGEDGDPQFTISAGHEHAVCYGISSYASNAMMSSNPHSGIYEANTARTLDLNGGNPACNQGGIAIVEPVPYTLKIRGGVEVDSAGKSAGKGALIQTNLSATLGVSQDQYLFQPVTIEPGIAAREGGHIYEGVCGTLRANADDNQMAVAYAIDQQGGKGGANYAENVMPTLCSDSHGTPHAVAYPVPGVLLDDQGGQQINVRTDDKCPTLRAEAHGNVPCVLEAGGFKELNSSKARSDGFGHEVSPCLAANKHDACVAYGETYQKVTGPLMANSHPGSYCGQDAYNDMFVVGKEHPIAIDRAFFNQGQNAQYDPQYYTDGTVPTLVARGPSAVAVRYIVRRLTPTECARLQGFPDKWGHPGAKEALTDEEYAFWLNVRNTHAEINGKAVKEYTRDQMLTWYNKLHTDSAEYKLWGNGIALPCALYVMEGIANEN